MKFRIIVIMIFVAAVTACGGAEERRTAHFEKALSFLESNDIDKARIELKNVIQIDPKFADAYYYMGTIREKEKEYSKAYGYYLACEELDPDHLKNQAKIGKIQLVLANDQEKAQEKIDFILSKEKDNPDGLLLQAMMLLKKGDKLEAAGLAKSILIKDPDHIDTTTFLATIYVGEKKNDQAISIIREALTLKPDDEILNSLLSRILILNEDYEAAEDVFIKLLEMDPESISGYNNLAALYDISGDKDKAEEILRLSIDQDPKDISRYTALITFIKKEKGEEEAISELESYSAKSSGLGELKVALGMLYYKNDNKDQALDVFNQVVSDFSEESTGIDARLAIATINMSDNDYEAATQMINDAIEISPNDSRVNMKQARLAILNKDYEKATISLRIVTKETPENIDAYYLLSEIYRLQGNPEQANDLLNSAYDNNRFNADVLLSLSKYYLNKDNEKSERIIDEFNTMRENNYEGMLVKSSLLNKQGKHADALMLANKLMDLFPDRSGGYLQAVGYYVKNDDREQAVSILEKGYTEVGTDKKIISLLTSLQIASGDYTVIVNRLNNEISKSPDAVWLRLLLSKVYIQKKDFDAAIDVLSETIGRNLGSEDAYLLLSQLYTNRDDGAQAISVLQEGKAAIEDSHKIPLRLATLFELDANYSKAIEVYSDLYKKYPDNLIVINNLASLLSENKKDENELELLNVLIEQLKLADKAVFLDTIGWTYYNLEDYDLAVEFLTKAVEQSPDVNIFNYHLGMTYKMKGSKEKAELYLLKSLENGKQFKERKTAEAELKTL